MKKLEYIINPIITKDQLWEFYSRNDICEVGYGKEIATKVLDTPNESIGVFDGEQLVGYARVLFDGVTSTLMEFCLECKLQGENLIYENGSIVEKDEYGIAQKMGSLLIGHLQQIGNTFISAYIIEQIEEPIYQSLGLKLNKGHLAYYLDDRPYRK